MTMTYEIAIETDSNSHHTTKSFASMNEAVNAAKEFARDWWRGAAYFVFCRETQEYKMGKAN